MTTMINKDRLLAITDGIVAIAATIMVLQLVLLPVIRMLLTLQVLVRVLPL